MAGHVTSGGMEDVMKRIILVKQEEKREKGRLRMRWVDGLEKDLRNLGMDNWKTRVQEKDGWRKFLE
jgi:hypothetical protein